MASRLGLVVVAALVLVVAIVAYQTSRVQSRQVPGGAPDQSPVNAEHMERTLSAAIRIPTVTTDRTEPDRTAFEALGKLLDDAFPRAHAALTMEVVSGYSRLYKWQGKESGLAPIALLAHLDVVPAEKKSWQVDPFSGAVQGESIWGRGALDDKGNVIAILEAVESLLQSGYQPRRTVYLAFGHDEEGGGNQGAAKMAEILRKRGRLAVALDEGANVFERFLPGIAHPNAAVAVAEKGILDVELVVNGKPGHSSMPGADNAIEHLNEAIRRVHDQPEKGRITAPIQQMLQYGAAEMNVPLRAAVSNLWLTRPLLTAQMDHTPMTAALLRSTIVPTLYQAGEKSNILPEKARAVLNVRLLPGDSSQAILQHIERAIHDSAVQVRAIEPHEAPPVSDLDSPPGKALQTAIRRIFPDAVVVPVLTPGATDSRHYRDVAGQVFRFSPFLLKREDLEQFHGRNERLSFRNCESAVRFYRQFIILEQN